MFSWSCRTMTMSATESSRDACVNGVRYLKATEHMTVAVFWPDRAAKEKKNPWWAHGNGFDQDAAIYRMRRYIICCIAARRAPFFRRILDLIATLLSLQQWNKTRSKDEQALDNLYLWRNWLDTQTPRKSHGFDPGYDLVLFSLFFFFLKYYIFVDK